MDTLKLLNVKQPPETSKDQQGNTTFKVGNRKTPLEIDILSLKLMVASMIQSLSTSEQETIRQHFLGLLPAHGLEPD